MNNRLTELAVGLLILLGIGGLFILTARVSNLDSYGGAGNTAYAALFDDIGGLKAGSAVKLSGVTVGRVSGIGFDATARKARVDFAIQDAYKNLPLDSRASIYTSGLLGENFLGLELGSSSDFLAAGEEIKHTDSAVVLEKTIAKIEDAIGGFLGAGSVPDDYASRSYAVHGLFEEIGGLKVGAQVKMSGVVIGYVTDIAYDENTFQAKVTAAIDNDYNYIPEDSGASILSSSLIGSQYLGIEPGGAMDALEDGDRLAYAQSAVILEKVISRVLFSMAAEDKSNE